MVKKYGRVVNTHHISYEPEITVDIFAGEHQCITLMERYSKRTVSKGFLRCLRRFIKENKHKAVKL
jgi:hypothetical protein